MKPANRVVLLGAAPLKADTSITFFGPGHPDSPDRQVDRLHSLEAHVRDNSIDLTYSADGGSLHLVSYRGDFLVEWVTHES